MTSHAPPVPIAIVNKPGGGGAAGIGYVAASRKADPHTLILINGSTQITPILNPQAKTLTEVTPVMNMMLDDFLLFVRADAPWKSAADFVKDAKSKPAKSVAFSTGGTYVNFLTADERGERLEAALGAGLARLAAVKAKWDPANVFRTNRNVLPS